MKKLLLIIVAFVVLAWSIPKPMESIENYNVMIIHGAYGAEKVFSACDENVCCREWSQCGK